LMSAHHHTVRLRCGGRNYDRFFTYVVCWWFGLIPLSAICAVAHAA
jgi:hypothetical protein